MTHEQLIDFSFNHLRDFEGSLGRKVSTVKWPVPSEIKLDQDQLLYKLPAVWKRLKLRRASVTDRILEQFANLETADAKDILAFAKRFGPLGLCQHGLGMSNRWHAAQLGRFCSSTTSAGYLCESLDDWSRWSRVFKSILECANALHGGEAPPETAWPVLLPKDLSINSFFKPLWPEMPRPEVTEVLATFTQSDKWQWLMDVINLVVLPQAALEPRCFKSDDAIEMRLAPASSEGALFAVLGSELAAAVTHAHTYYTCSNCGAWFSPDSLKHKAKTGTRRYCNGCKKAALRDAKRDQRKREAGAKLSR